MIPSKQHVQSPLKQNIMGLLILLKTYRVLRRISRRVQNLYSRKRKQLATEILDCKLGSAKCDVDPQIVQETYQARFGGESQEVNLSKYPKAKSADNDMLLKPITQQEIYKAYSRAKKDSASGPDGLGLKKLKQLDPQVAMTQTSLLNG